MNKRLLKLKDRAIKAGAIENWKDAYRDLIIFPDLHKQILDDLVEAIEAWEQIKKEKENVYMFHLW